jgi:hypothetical protein
MKSLVARIFHDVFDGGVGKDQTPATEPARPRGDRTRTEYAGVSALEALIAAGDPARAYVGHVTQKLRMADYCAARATSVLAGDAEDVVPEWDRDVPLNTYVFACISSLASALDNLAVIANTLAELGVAEHRVDFPYLAGRPEPKLVAWRETSAAGNLAAEFYADPWIAYFYELRRRLTHHTIARKYGIHLGSTTRPPNAFDLEFPEPGKPNVAGGGPEAQEALAVFVELVGGFADDFGSLLAAEVTPGV